MTTGGNLARNLNVESLYEIDALSSEIGGLIGDPVNFDTTSDFEEATLTFAVDKTKLAEGVEFDNLAVLWYDEENQFYELVPSQLDAVNSTVTTTVNHFSTYVVVDGEQWAVTWQGAPEYIYGSHMYAVIDGITSEAQAYCESLGGHAVTITSAEEQAHVMTLMMATGKNSRYTIGLEKQTPESEVFTWVTGEPYGYTNWAPKETGIWTTEDGVVKMHGPQTADCGKWYDTISIFEALDSTNRGIICEWENVADIIHSGTPMDKDNDGLPDFMETGGIPLPNGRVIYLDPNNPDTDGDGILDGDEIALRIQIVDWDEAHNPIYGFTGFGFYSEPTLADSDGDGVADANDSTPLKKNGEMNYIFYDKNIEDESDKSIKILENEAHHREKLMKKDGKKVELIVAETTDDFINKWNQMGLDTHGKEKYKISNVYTVYHGSRDFFTIISNEENFWTSEVSRLSNKNIDVLNLSSCVSGNLDFINSWSYNGKQYGQNMAVMMMKGCSNIKTVKAWDGVSSYIPIGSGIEYDSIHPVFMGWSMEKSGKMRKPEGLITYTREPDGSISYSPAFKSYLNANQSPTRVEMTEKIS